MFKQYDVVRITRLPAAPAADGFAINQRPPRLGDIAAIVEVYEKPELDYEPECTASGETQWLCSFSAAEIELELVARPDVPD